VVPLIGATNPGEIRLGELAGDTARVMALKEVSGMENGPVDTTGINFRLAPRINAAAVWTMPGNHPSVHVEGPERVRRIAAHLNELNVSRQRIEEKILTEAGNDPIPRAGRNQAIHRPGIPGMASGGHRHCGFPFDGRISLPTILIALRERIGEKAPVALSMLSLYEGLKACQGWMEAFGGHAQAAGLVIRAERIPDFARAFDEVVAARLKEDDFIPA